MYVQPYRFGFSYFGYVRLALAVSSFHVGNEIGIPELLSNLRNKVKYIII